MASSRAMPHANNLIANPCQIQHGQLCITLAFSHVPLYPIISPLPTFNRSLSFKAPRPCLFRERATSLQLRTAAQPQALLLSTPSRFGVCLVIFSICCGLQRFPIFFTLSTALYVTQCICNTLNLASTYANPSKHLFPTCFVPNMSSYASSATLQGAATFGPGLYNCLILAKELQHPRSPMRYRHQLSLSTMDYDLSKSRASVGTMRNERWVSWGPDR